MTHFVAFALCLGTCTFLAASTAYAQPKEEEASPAYFTVLEALGAEPVGTESPTCLRGLSAPYATLGPQIEAAMQRRGDIADAMYTALGSASTPEVRTTSRTAIASFLEAADEVERLVSRYRIGVYEALEREREANAFSADSCRIDFDARIKRVEPYKRRLYAVGVVWLQTMHSAFAVQNEFADTASKFGSRELVPRTDPSYLAMLDMAIRYRLTEKELERAKAALAAYKGLQ